jgi:bud emergence protein 1
MKGLKEFRRSLNKDRTSGGRPGGHAPAVFMGVKNAVSIQPPKKVIRATRDYRSRAPQELSFSKGDFFHVLNDDDGSPDWLEATNPLTNARGLVPASYFDILSRGGRTGGQNIPLGGAMAGMPPSDGSSSAAAGGVGTAAGSSVVAKQGGGFYAVVKFDFVAERADELQASAGEPIIVIAQSNFEWFVAKPIGRLGGPGLIPVSFVELKDVTNGQKVENVDDLISRGVIPKVEEWKKQTADYKKNTIPLGRFDFPNNSNSLAGAQPGAGVLSDTTSQQTGGATGGLSSSPRVPSKDGGAAYDPNTRISQASQSHLDAPPELPPGMPPGEPLPTGIVTAAQVDSFHFEQGDYWFRIQATHIAGHSPSAPPTAPTAPAGEERDLILYRLYEDFYEFQIALLDHFPAEAGRETQANGQPSERILPLMPGPLDQVDDIITSQRRQDLDTYTNELVSLPEYITRSELVRLFFEPRPGDHCTVQPLPDLPSAGVRKSQQGAPGGLGGAGMATTGASGQSNGTSKYAEEAPVGPNAQQQLGSTADDATKKMYNLGLNSSHDVNGAESYDGASSQLQSSSAGGGPRKPASGSYDSRGSSMHAGGGNSSAGATTPAAPSPAFIKIKIFNRATDDLVAIRVPPSVTFNALLDKVRERLGADITILRYRDVDAGPNVMMRLSDNDDLQDFLSTGDKLQLFADVK